MFPNCSKLFTRLGCSKILSPRWAVRNWEWRASHQGCHQEERGNIHLSSSGASDGWTGGERYQAWREFIHHLRPPALLITLTGCSGPGASQLDHQTLRPERSRAGQGGVQVRGPGFSTSEVHLGGQGRTWCHGERRYGLVSSDSSVYLRPSKVCMLMVPTEDWVSDSTKKQLFKAGNWTKPPELWQPSSWRGRTRGSTPASLRTTRADSSPRPTSRWSWGRECRSCSTTPTQWVRKGLLSPASPQEILCLR